MATFAKELLSESTNGRQIVVGGSSSVSPTTIHTAPAGTTSLDEVWLYAYNESTASIMATILWGDQTEPSGSTRFTLESRAGRILLVDGKLIQNGLSVYAYAGFPNVIIFDGFVNRITA